MVVCSDKRTDIHWDLFWKDFTRDGIGKLLISYQGDGVFLATATSAFEPEPAPYGPFAALV